MTHGREETAPFRGLDEHGALRKGLLAAGLLALAAGGFSFAGERFAAIVREQGNEIVLHGDLSRQLQRLFSRPPAALGK